MQSKKRVVKVEVEVVPDREKSGSVAATLLQRTKFKFEATFSLHFIPLLVLFEL